MITLYYFTPQTMSGFPLQLQVQPYYGYGGTQTQTVVVPVQEMTPTVVYPAQQPLITMNQYAQAGTVLVQPQQYQLQLPYTTQYTLVPCNHAPGMGATACWMHRPPGDLMQLGQPAPGRPGQWVQWCNGAVTWLAAPVETA